MGTFISETNRRLEVALAGGTGRSWRKGCGAFLRGHPAMVCWDSGLFWLLWDCGQSWGHNLEDEKLSFPKMPSSSRHLSPRLPGLHTPHFRARMGTRGSHTRTPSPESWCFLGSAGHLRKGTQRLLPLCRAPPNTQDWGLCATPAQSKPAHMAHAAHFPSSKLRLLLTHTQSISSHQTPGVRPVSALIIMWPLSTLMDCECRAHCRGQRLNLL